MKMAMISQPGAALLHNSRDLNSYMPAKQRLIVYYLDILDIIMELGNVPTILHPYGLSSAPWPC